MLQKLGSRKFIVTLFTLASALAGLDLDPLQLGVIGVVATVYVLAEAIVDRKRAEAIANSVQRGLELGREVSTKGASE